MKVESFVTVETYSNLRSILFLNLCIHQKMEISSNDYEIFRYNIFGIPQQRCISWDSYRSTVDDERG